MRAGGVWTRLIDMTVAAAAVAALAAPYVASTTTSGRAIAYPAPKFVEAPAATLTAGGLMSGGPSARIQAVLDAEPRPTSVVAPPAPIASAPLTLDIATSAPRPRDTPPDRAQARPAPPSPTEISSPQRRAFASRPAPPPPRLRPKQLATGTSGRAAQWSAAVVASIQPSETTQTAEASSEAPAGEILSAEEVAALIARGAGEESPDGEGAVVLLAESTADSPQDPTAEGVLDADSLSGEVLTADAPGAPDSPDASSPNVLMAEEAAPPVDSAPTAFVEAPEINTDPLIVQVEIPDAPSAISSAALSASASANTDAAPLAAQPAPHIAASAARGAAPHPDAVLNAQAQDPGPLVIATGPDANAPLVLSQPIDLAGATNSAVVETPEPALAIAQAPAQSPERTPEQTPEQTAEQTAEQTPPSIIAQRPPAPTPPASPAPEQTALTDLDVARMIYGDQSATPGVGALATTTQISGPALVSASFGPPSGPVDAPLSDAARIVLVVGALGLNDALTRRALSDLPEGVTLAFAPARPDAARYARRAAREGREFLVEIPMEPVNYPALNPGPLTLLTGDGPAINAARIDSALARVPGAVGASAYLGARFAASPEASAALVAALAQRDLPLYEGRPSARSLLDAKAAEAGLAYLRGGVLIDVDRDPAAIDAALARLEETALQTGLAIGAGAAYAETLAAVGRWADGLEQRGARLVPITQAFPAP